MRTPVRNASLLLLAVALMVVVPPEVEGQILERIRGAAARAAEDETTRQLERMIRSGVACVFTDRRCIESAGAAGDDVYLTDEEGEPILDDKGLTVQDPDQAADLLGRDTPGDATRPGAPGARAGAGADANYDFEPGERPILSVDYSEDNLGDFPRRFDLIAGSWDVIDWQGDRYLRAVSGGALAIVLPETLPEKFTLETAVSVQHGNAYFSITPGPAYEIPPRNYRGSAVSVHFTEAGVTGVQGGGPRVMSPHDHQLVSTSVLPLRVMADGEHMKVYFGEQRVANVPNAVFPRSDTLYVSVAWAHPDRPILMGPIHIASGGADLYSRLERDGRVATQGILFDVNSDVIRPESAPTLAEIATMLRQHPELRIAIEGHTDSDGEAASNQELSERRAAAVKRYLVESYEIDGSRLESAGFGESRPVASNDTPEGKQENRRVELVRLP
jgi:OmpA-OmpF porin, OOP family